LNRFNQSALSILNATNNNMNMLFGTDHLVIFLVTTFMWHMNTSGVSAQSADLNYFMSKFVRVLFLATSNASAVNKRGKVTSKANGSAL
jgi:hypothetical protein